MMCELPPEGHPFQQVSQLFEQKDDVFGSIKPHINSDGGHQQKAKDEGAEIGHEFRVFVVTDGFGCDRQGLHAQVSQPSRPMATATSAIRAENAHSLSYHARTRTSRPPMTLVCSGAKMLECSV